MELFSIRIQRTFQLVSTHMEEHLEKSSFAITFCFFSVFIVLLKNNGMGVII